MYSLGTAQEEALHLAKKKDEITIRPSAAEYLTYVASVGDQQDSMLRYLILHIRQKK